MGLEPAPDPSHELLASYLGKEGVLREIVAVDLFAHLKLKVHGEHLYEDIEASKVGPVVIGDGLLDLVVEHVADLVLGAQPVQVEQLLLEISLRLIVVRKDRGEGS